MPSGMMCINGESVNSICRFFTVDGMSVICNFSQLMTDRFCVLTGNPVRLVRLLQFSIVTDVISQGNCGRVMLPTY